MTLQAKYNKPENDCSNGPRPAPPLIVDPNPPHDLKHFSLILRLENTARRSSSSPSTTSNAAASGYNTANANTLPGNQG